MDSSLIRPGYDLIVAVHRDESRSRSGGCRPVAIVGGNGSIFLPRLAEDSYLIALCPGHCKFLGHILIYCLGVRRCIHRTVPSGHCSRKADGILRKDRLLFPDRFLLGACGSKQDGQNGYIRCVFHITLVLFIVIFYQFSRSRSTTLPPETAGPAVCLIQRTLQPPNRSGLSTVVKTAASPGFFPPP